MHRSTKPKHRLCNTLCAILWVCRKYIHVHPYDYRRYCCCCCYWMATLNCTCTFPHFRWERAGYRFGSCAKFYMQITFCASILWLSAQHKVNHFNQAIWIRWIGTGFARFAFDRGNLKINYYYVKIGRFMQIIIIIFFGLCENRAMQKHWWNALGVRMLLATTRSM